MRGRLFTLLLAAAGVSGCLSVLAPDVERGVPAHAGMRDTTAPGVCLTCHREEPALPPAQALPPQQTQPLPRSMTAAMSEAPWVPAWMLRERGGECLACHGVTP